MDACPCTCRRVIEQDEDEDEQDNEDIDFNGGQTDPDDPGDVVLLPIEVCPKKYDESNDATPLLCFPEYKDKLTCDYEYTYQGCTWDTLECVAIRSCTCNYFGDNEWACTLESMTSCDIERPEERPPRGDGESDVRSLLRVLHNHHDNHHDTGEEKHTRRARRRDLTGDISAPKLNGTPCNPLNFE